MKRMMMLLVFVAALVDVGVATRDACAIVGRPLTPMSYAGVARRTTRRMAYASAAAAPVYVAPPAAAYW